MTTITERARAGMQIIHNVNELPAPEDRGQTYYFLAEPWGANTNGYAGPAESRWDWRSVLKAGNLVVDRLWAGSKRFVASNRAEPDAGIWYITEEDLQAALEAPGAKAHLKSSN